MARSWIGKFSPAARLKPLTLDISACHQAEHPLVAPYRVVTTAFSLRNYQIAGVVPDLRLLKNLTRAEAVSHR